MIFPDKGCYAYAIGIVFADTVVAKAEFVFIVGALSPGVPHPWLSRNINIHAVNKLLDSVDQLFRQDFLCVYIARICLLAAITLRKRKGYTKTVFIFCIACAYTAIT